MLGVSEERHPLRHLRDLRALCVMLFFCSPLYICEHVHDLAAVSWFEKGIPAIVGLSSRPPLPQSFSSSSSFSTSTSLHVSGISRLVLSITVFFRTQNRS